MFAYYGGFDLESTVDSVCIENVGLFTFDNPKWNKSYALNRTY